jgi:ubiquinone/menaquinone biosynthesis C-methylase UbiE
MKNHNLIVCILIPIILVFTSASKKIPQIKLTINSKESLMRIGIDPHPVSIETDKKMATIVWDAVTNNNRDAAQKAVSEYEDMMSKETRTRDYSSLQWLCQTILSSDDERKKLLSDKVTDYYYHYFTDSGYLNLKEYLLRKYKLNNYTPKNPEEHIERRAFLEDLLMFNDPNRAKWDNTEELLRHIPLKQGDKVVDIGCGFGYFSYHLSKKVGNNGKVYACDTQEPYVNYVKNFVKNYQQDNIVPVLSTNNDISVNDVVDVAFMCSVYHIIYGWAKEVDRTAFLNTLRRTLKKDGLLIIADNSPLNGEEMNNCFLNKGLIISQLIFYGFQYVDYFEITPKRYMLIFRHRPGKLIDIDLTDKNSNGEKFRINVTSGNSLIHIGSLDSYDITPEGISAAKLVLDALSNNNLESAAGAIKAYNRIIPIENFGGEYTVLRWFCEYLISDTLQQKKYLEDPLTKAYYNYLAKDNYTLLKEYLKSKYRLGKEERKEEEGKIMTEEDREVGRTRRAYLEDFILFNNPRREEWEKTSAIMQQLNIKDGETIADIGCGSGYYTWKFSNLIGDKGKIYAVDIKQEHLNFIDNFVKDQKINNIQTIKCEEDNINVKTKVDLVFMCSLYHTIYGIYSEPERNSFIESIKMALKKDGRLIIIDNGPVTDQNLPYHGPYITKELIEYQLAYYGFKLEKYVQIIPQRYLLTFKLI